MPKDKPKHRILKGLGFLALMGGVFTGGYFTNREVEKIRLKKCACCV